MKKFVSILLALTILFSLSVTAFAAENTTTLTVSSDTNRTYVGHQLLELKSMNLKPEGEHENCTLTNAEEGHKDTCYNYAYEVVDKYMEILQQEVHTDAGANFWGNTLKPAVGDITEEHILEYLAGLTSDGADGYGTMRKVADRIYRNIKTAGIAPEQGEFKSTAQVAKGYWIFVDVSNLAGANDANSLVVVDTLGRENLTIKEKTGLPTLTKKVQDIEDSENESIANTPWYDSADHDVGDKVPFKLTAGMPSNIQYYNSYTLKFHDTLSTALVLSQTNRLTANDENPKFYKVFMYADEYVANQDFDLNGGVDVTEHFTAGPMTDPHSFVLTGDIYQIPNAHAVITPSTHFVVYYEAELTANGLVLGNDGNPNTAYLEYSNDPYSDSFGKSEESTAVVFTYKFIVEKVDQAGVALPGAGFTLFKKYVDGREVPIGEQLGGVTDPTMTTFTWTGLDDGDYILKETTVPAGYNGMEDRSFTITADHSLESTDPKVTALHSTSFAGDVAKGSITATIENRTGTVLPETGAQGTFLLITCSSMFVLVAVVFMVTRKRMSIYED